MKSSANSIWKTKTTRQFAETVATISSVENMQKFLRDVMTEKEIIEISSRLEAARMLKDGKKYAEIIEKTKLSSRTVARISEWMKKGSGGYDAALRTMNAYHSHLSPARA